MTTEAETNKGTLAEKGSWDDFDEKNQDAPKGNGNGNSDRPKTEYLVTDTDKPGKYTFVVRPVGPHVKCRKFFKPYQATLNDADRGTDPAWKAGFWPQKRYAINIIDRADGRLKVLEKGASVFKGFANYKAVFSKNPSDAKEGADFQITMTVPKLANGKPNKLKTEYMVTHLKETPLTKEEIDMIKAQKLWPLTEIYKSRPSLEKRTEMWNSLSDEEKVAPKREEKGAVSADSKSESRVEPKPVETVEETTAGSPADSEDLFGDGNKDTNIDSTEMF